MADFSTEGATSVRATCRRQRQLGRELRRFFDHVALEPVPVEMLALLNNFDETTEDPSNGPDDNRNGKIRRCA